MRRALVLGLVLVGACGGRSVYLGDLGDDDAAIDRDARATLDGGRDAGVDAGRDAGVCEDRDRHRIEQVPLAELWVPAGALSVGLPERVAVRLRALVEVGGCDRLAGVQPEILWSSGRVALTAYVWRYEGPNLCPLDISLQPEWIDVGGLLAGQWTIYDTAGGVTEAGLYVRACLAGEDCRCERWDGIPGGPGDSCQYDCMCEQGLGCVWEAAVGGGLCYRTCSTDRDCPLPQSCLYGWDDLPEGVCDLMRPPCASDTECAPGFACVPDPSGAPERFCQPVMDWEDHRHAPCGADCDCAAGLICAQTPSLPDLHCEIPCRGDGDCPDGLTCDSYFLGEEMPNQLVCNEVVAITMLAPIE